MWLNGKEATNHSAHSWERLKIDRNEWRSLQALKINIRSHCAMDDFHNNIFSLCIQICIPVWKNRRICSAEIKNVPLRESRAHSGSKPFTFHELIVLVSSELALIRFFEWQSKNTLHVKKKTRTILREGRYKTFVTRKHSPAPSEL